MAQKTRARWIRRGIILAILIGLGAMVPRWLQKKPLSVKTVRVEKGLVRDIVSSSTAGEVVPLKRATIRAELGARVVDVKFRRGQRVKRGAVVVVLDAQDLDARLQQGQATLRAQEGALAQARARAESTARAADRARNLQAKGAGTGQVVDEAEGLAREAKEAVRASEGQLAQAQATLKLNQVSRGKAALTAPFDGLLVEVRPDPGEELAPGTPVFELIDDSELRVDASIDEADVGRVSVGQKAEIVLDALPGKSVAGKVTLVGPAVRRDLKGARTLPIEVGIEKATPEIRAGMSANIEIVVAQKQDVASLPTNVIVGRGAKRSVFKIEDGVARSREIQVGISNWDKSEILGGINVGDEVVANLNTKELEDGVRVTPAK